MNMKPKMFLNYTRNILIFYFNNTLFYLILTHSPLNHPQPPVRIQVVSTLCEVISFNGQGQLSSLTCAKGRDLSIHTRMSAIQSRIPEKEAENHVTLT